MSIYKSQTLAPISIDTGLSNLASATVKKILFMRPDRTTGAWEGTVSGTKLTYAPQAGDINLPGIWTLQTFVTISGKDGYGSRVQMQVQEPLPKPTE
jgi:hypothetical protein